MVSGRALPHKISKRLVLRLSAPPCLAPLDHYTFLGVRYINLVQYAQVHSWSIFCTNYRIHFHTSAPLTLLHKLYRNFYNFPRNIYVLPPSCSEHKVFIL